MPRTNTSGANTAKPAAARKSAAATKTPVAAPKTDVEPKAAVKPAKKAAKPAPKAKPDTEAREKVKKPKLVRDSFTMPEAEYAVLGDVKKACLKAGIEVKKSELLRVGVALIRQLDTARLKEILTGLPTLKAGRPTKGK
ncbi:MAG: hypothetical protein ACREX0_08410 [Noviherbaspirillum sp.]